MPEQWQMCRHLSLTGNKDVSQLILAPPFLSHLSCPPISCSFAVAVIEKIKNVIMTETLPDLPSSINTRDLRPRVFFCWNVCQNVKAEMGLVDQCLGSVLWSEKVSFFPLFRIETFLFNTIYIILCFT